MPCRVGDEAPAVIGFQQIVGRGIAWRNIHHAATQLYPWNGKRRKAKIVSPTGKLKFINF
jgi:hypothetical protein